MPKNQTVYKIIATIAIAIVAISAVFFVQNQDKGMHYNDYTSENPYQDLQDHSDLDKINYSIVYREGCQHCAKAESTITDNLRRLKKDKIPFTVTNVNNAPNNVLNYLSKRNITQTPTIIVQYKTYTLYAYTGINKTIINTLLKGINPDTSKKFTATKPKATVYKNDITKSFNKTPVNDPD